MKRLVIVILCILFLFCGCASQRELNTLMIVLGVGFDKDNEQTSNVKLTAQLVLPDIIKAQTQGSVAKPYWNVESSGTNTFEAVRGYSDKLSSRLYIAHTEIFVFGRDLAREGIEKPFDFFIRAKETRPTTLILISDTTAKDLFDTDVKINLLPAINLTKMLRAQQYSSDSKDVTVTDYINAMLSKTTSFVAPIAGTQVQGESKIPDIKGLAVFKKDKMVGEMNEKESRGLLWVKGWVKGGILSINIADGQAALELLNASGSVSPTVNNGKVKMKIIVEATSVMGEQTTTENLATEENIKKMQDLAEKAIMKEIIMSFDKAKSLHADVFGFGEEIHKTGAPEWEEMEKNWDSIFPNIELDISAKMTITSTGIITKPIKPE